MQKVLVGLTLLSYSSSIIDMIKLLHKIVGYIQTAYSTYKYISYCKCIVCEYNRKNNINPIH